jgi:hypothetical protein
MLRHVANNTDSISSHLQHQSPPHLRGTCYVLLLLLLLLLQQHPQRVKLLHGLLRCLRAAPL